MAFPAIYAIISISTIKSIVSNTAKNIIVTNAVNIIFASTASIPIEINVKLNFIFP